MLACCFGVSCAIIGDHKQCWVFCCCYFCVVLFCFGFKQRIQTYLVHCSGHCEVQKHDTSLWPASGKGLHAGSWQNRGCNMKRQGRQAIRYCFNIRVAPEIIHQSINPLIRTEPSQLSPLPIVLSPGIINL